MNRTEHLLTCLAEECAEVAQRSSKALRFGLAEIQPGQGLTNSERITYELSDLFAIVCILDQEGLVKWPEQSVGKAEKVEKVMRYAKEECGTLCD